MESHGRRLLGAAAVLLGALGLVGVPVFLLVVLASQILLAVGGASVGGDVPRLPFLVLAAGVALTVTVEAAAVRLHGDEALGRGTGPQRGVRLLAVAAAVLAGVVVVVDVLVRVGVWAFARGDWLVLALVVTVAVALAWGVGRAANALGRGYGGVGGD